MRPRSRGLRRGRPLCAPPSSAPRDSARDPGHFEPSHARARLANLEEILILSASCPFPKKDAPPGDFPPLNLPSLKLSSSFLARK